jgi:hypothetical protein
MRHGSVRMASKPSGTRARVDLWCLDSKLHIHLYCGRRTPLDDRLEGGIGVLKLVVSSNLRYPFGVRTLLRAILIRNRLATFCTYVTKCVDSDFFGRKCSTSPAISSRPHHNSAIEIYQCPATRHVPVGCLGME